MSRERRLAKELQDITKDQDSSGIHAWPVSDGTLTHLRGSFPGPPDTPYAGGTFEIEINIPENYPFKSPSMKFVTKIWHPNISSQTGAICLDTLSTNWSPVQTIKTALLSLRLLLEVPNPQDPQDAEVARMMIDDPVRFARTAQAWAIEYAAAPKRDLDLKPFEDMEKNKPGVKDNQKAYQGYNRNLIDRFTTMGFEVEAVVSAFQHFGIPNNGGNDFALEEAYVGDITARLLGEF